MPDASATPVTVFEYLYRDASNYKSHGQVYLSGRLSDADRALIVSKLQDGEYFIAEQVGIPSLRQSLYELSDGPTDDDHAWHEFGTIVDGPSLGDEILWGSAAELLLNFQKVESWNLALSEFTN